MKEQIAQIAILMAKQVLQMKVTELLQKGKAQLPKEKYDTFLKVGDSFFQAMEELAHLTKTSLDDTAVTVFSEPIKAAIEENKPGL